MPNHPRTIAVFATALSLLAAGVPTSLAALGDAQFNAANKLVVAPAGNTPADPVLFPAIAAMTPAPASLTDWMTASLMTTQSPEWSEVEAWVKAEPQQKAIEALGKVADIKAKSLFTMPYTAKGVDPAWVKAGLVIDTGTHGILAGAQFRYFSAIRPLLLLATTEAERLAAAGEGAKSAKVMLDTIRLGRILADRPTLDEKLVGIRMMHDGAERLRDLVYVHPDAFKIEDLKQAVLELDERLINVMKIRLPEADHLAAEQLIEMTIEERGEVDGGKLGATMSRLGSSDRPLLRFAEAAKWKKVAEVHAGWFDTRDELKKIWGDWTTRWNLQDLHDPLLRKATDYQKMAKGKFAILDETLAGVDQMRDRRLRLLAEMSGTRGALAVTALTKRSRAIPPAIQAVIPDFARREYLTDAYSYDRRYRTQQQLEFFVPIRDQKFGPRELPHPHEVLVVVSEDESEIAPAASGDLAGMITNIGELLLAYKKATGEKPSSAAAEAIKGLSITPREKASFTQMLLIMKQDVASGQNIAELVKEEIMATPTGQVRRVANELEIDPDNLKAYAAEVFSGLYASEPIKNAVQQLSSSTSTLSDDVVKQVRDQFFALSFRQETIDKYLKPAAAEAEPEEASGGRTSFVAELDEKVFVLYSVGPDGQDNEARNVGAEGDDILYWPPVISLYREHLN